MLALSEIARDQLKHLHVYISAYTRSSTIMNKSVQCTGSSQVALTQKIELQLWVLAMVPSEQQFCHQHQRQFTKS